MKKIAIIGSIHQDGLNLLKKLKFSTFEITDFTQSSLEKKLSDVVGIILRTAKINSKVIEKCTKLKIIARHGVGYDNIDLNCLNEKKIALAVTGTANAASVSEHVMAMFLYLTKRMNQLDQLVKKNEFTKRESIPDFFELYQKNILIVGFGKIGQEVAKRCIGFDSKVYVYDPFVDEKSINDKNCYKIDLNDGVKLADFVTIHVPLNNQTNNLITKKQFRIMKKNCVLINTARGGIVNEEDLFWALKNKQIYAAGLDVYEKEPPKINHPLFKLENIVLTPHNAALTLECRKRMALECAENINYYLNKSSKLNYSNIVNRKYLDL